jgi:TatD DNase family protein
MRFIFCQGARVAELMSLRHYIWHMTYIDAHTHVQFHAFTHDFQEVIGRALRGGVWLINVGTQRDTSRKAVEIAREYPEGVYAAVGLHPIHTSKSFHDAQELGDTNEAKGFVSRGEEFDFAYYEELAADPKVVAIGECGLDYYRMSPQAEREVLIAKQKDAFRKQIELAGKIGKPLMIHCREAFGDLISTLYACRSALPDPAGAVHFFTGTPEEAKRLLDMGFVFTFGGAITFTRAYDATIKMLPPEAILSETDAPYVAPVPYRGKRNEPLYVIEVVKKLAELKGMSPEQMAETTFNNAKRVFGI